MVGKDKYGYRETFPRYYKADFELQQRVGTGALDAEAVANVQKLMDSVSVDVTPELREYLGIISSTLAETKDLKYDREQFLPVVSKALMNIKATSGMFHEMMICRVSAFVLTFLEDVKKFDTDAADIVGVCVKVCQTLLDLKIKDERDENGQKFLSEIRSACKRYYEKQDAAIRG